MFFPNSAGLNDSLLYPSPQRLHPHIQHKARLSNSQVRLLGQFLPIHSILPNTQRLNPYTRLSVEFLLALSLLIASLVTNMGAIGGTYSLCCELLFAKLTTLS